MSSQQWTDEQCAAMRQAYDASSQATWSDVGEQFGTTGDGARNAVRRWERRAENDERVKQAAYQKVAERRRLENMFPDWERPEDVPWRDWFASWGRTNKLHRAIDPAQEQLTVNLSRRTEPVAVAFAADLHLGGGYTDHEAIRRSIDYILETDGLYVGFVGDGIEGFIPGMKSAETTEQMPSSLKAQLDAYRSLVEELADAGKILFLTWGDHDAKWFEQAIGLNVVKRDIHDTAPYFTGRGLVTLKVGDEEYYVQVNHSERFNSQWNPNHPQRRQYERFFPADVNVSAHKHKPAFQCFHHYSELREAGLNAGGKTWLVATGTFKTGPDPYTIRSWTRGIIGVPTVVFSPGGHDTDCFESPEKAMAFIRGAEAA